MFDLPAYAVLSPEDMVALHREAAAMSPEERQRIAEYVQRDREALRDELFRMGFEDYVDAPVTPEMAGTLNALRVGNCIIITSAPPEPVKAAFGFGSNAVAPSKNFTPTAMDSFPIPMTVTTPVTKPLVDTHLCGKCGFRSAPDAPPFEATETMRDLPARLICWTCYGQAWKQPPAAKG